MALSDHERKLLAEMEAALEQEDPRLLSTLTGKARTRQSSRALLGLSILALGAVVLISGLVAQATIVGVIAFVICLAGVLLIITNISLNSGGKRLRNRAGAQAWRRDGIDVITRGKALSILQTNHPSGWFFYAHFQGGNGRESGCGGLKVGKKGVKW